MTNHPMTDAIIAEANAEVNKPYTTARKIEGYFNNMYKRSIRSMFGGSDDAKSKAEVVGRNLVTVAPQALAAGAAQIPVVGNIAETAVSVGGEMIADAVVEKLDSDRVTELKAKQQEGTLSVREMTEMMQKSADINIGDDFQTKMQDAVRKLDEAYSDAKDAITTANDSDSVYAAAKKYYYLKYRIVRLQYYVEIMRTHVDKLSEMNERYGAQTIGFEYDLIDMMNEFFNNQSPGQSQA